MNSRLHVVHGLHVLCLMMSVCVMVSLVVMLSLTSHHVSLTVVEVSIHSLILLHNLKQLLENLSHVWMTDQIIQMESSILLSLILLEIGFINGLFFLNFSQLLDLIVINHEGLTFDGMIVECLFSLCCSSWLLEADESEGIVAFLF